MMAFDYFTNLTLKINNHHFTAGSQKPLLIRLLVIITCLSMHRHTERLILPLIRAYLFSWFGIIAYFPQ